VIELLEEKIKAQKDNEKDYYGKLQKCDYEVNLVVDKNDKIIKEVRTIEERNRQLEFNLKNKQTELAETLKKYS
jgi:small nuclear ribonucleoprotein (snRNP)-like protein